MAYYFEVFEGVVIVEFVGVVEELKSTALASTAALSTADTLPHLQLL